MFNELPAFDLLQETIGKSMAKAIRELGCPAMPMELLLDKHMAFLHSELQGLPTDKQELNHLINKGVLDGEVIRVGVSPEGHHLFTVRFPLKQMSCVLTLAYYQEHWSIERFETLETRRAQFNRMLLGGIGGVVITAMVAFMAWGLNSGDIVEEAKTQGFVVLTQEQYNEQIKTSEAIGEARIADGGKGAAADKAKSQKGKTVASNAAGNGEEVKFTLEQGMTTGDLTSFLQQEGLVQDQASFNQELTSRGIDTMLQPKEYVFKKGMTEEEILTVLQG